MLMVEGEPARALDELVRERWQRATGERVAPPPARRPPLTAGRMASSSGSGPCRSAIARTRPACGEQAAAREIEALYLSAIGAARRCIYIENQYLTVPADRRGARGAAGASGDGPEVVIIGPKQCEASSRPR